MSHSGQVGRWAAIFAVLIQLSLAKSLATVTPCPDCAASIAPKPVVITAQYQTVSTCEPATTTVFYPYTKPHITSTSSKIETVPSCSPYAWVSTTIPVYDNSTKTSTVVTSTDQPITFNSLHYTETHSTTVTLPSYGSKYNHTWHRNATYPRTTVKKSYTTIDIKDYCDYDSLGPIAIPGYKGSGLCTDCGPDVNSALTQRFTVVSCANNHCTTFNETWISSPKTYSSEGSIHTTATTNTYCPTATPTTAIPGYTHPAPTGQVTSIDSHPSSGAAPTGYASPPSGYPTAPSSAHPAQPTPYASPPSGYPTVPNSANPAQPTPTDDYEDDNPGPTPTDDYDTGSPDPSSDPSGDMGYEHPAPSPYHPGPPSYKVWKRQGLEKPRGQLMKRAGLLFFQN